MTSWNSTLKPGGPLKRYKRLRQVSAKRARQNRQRRAMVAARWPERPLCVVYELSQTHPGVVPAKVLDRCGRWADDVHETLSRARGGSITDRANVIPPCRWCHDAVTPGPLWALRLGLVKHSWPGGISPDAPMGGDAA